MVNQVSRAASGLFACMRITSIIGRLQPCFSIDPRTRLSYCKGIPDEIRTTAQGLFAAVHSDEEVGKTIGGNFVGLWRRIVD
jgi:hypothetical protein